MTESLIHALVKLQEKEALQSVQQLLDAGTEPMAILAACSAAMEQVGRRFEKGEYFLPQLMMAGEMLKQISGMLRPLMAEAQTGPGPGSDRHRQGRYP